MAVGAKGKLVVDDFGGRVSALPPVVRMGFALPSDPKECA